MFVDIGAHPQRNGLAGFERHDYLGVSLVAAIPLQPGLLLAIRHFSLSYHSVFVALCQFLFHGGSRHAGRGF